MRKTFFVALCAGALAVAGPSVAGDGMDRVQTQLKTQGYKQIKVQKHGHESHVKGHKGDETVLVVIDTDSEEILRQGKFQNGDFVGSQIIPARAHKDDGVKYGDRDQTNVNPDSHGPAAGEAGGKATHERGGGAGGGVNPGTGKSDG